MRAFLSRHRFILVASATTVVVMAMNFYASIVGTGGFQPARLLVQPLQTAARRALDLQFAWRSTHRADPRVLIAAIDEKSVQRYGDWPWPRALTARGIVALHRLGAKAIGLDVAFIGHPQTPKKDVLTQVLAGLDQAVKDQPDLASRLAAYRARVRRLEPPDGDATLASALELPGVIEGVFPFARANYEANAGLRLKTPDWVACLAKHVITRVPGRIEGSSYPIREGWDLGQRYFSAQAPLPQLCGPSTSLASLHAKQDTDGTLRRMKLFAQLEEPRGLLPSLSLAVAARYLGAVPDPVFDPHSGHLDGIRLLRGGRVVRSVPVSWGAQSTLIPWMGDPGAFHRISFSDLLDGKVPRAEVQGKAVLVGVTLLGQVDNVSTPLDPAAPGLLGHATMLSAILSGHFLRHSATSIVIEVLFMILAAVLCGLVLPRVPFTWKLGLLLGTTVVWVYFTHVMFERGLLIRAFYPLVDLFVCGFAVIFLGYLTVDRDRHQLKGAFSRYLSKGVMDQMLAHPERLKLGGEKREMTVLFADLRGFTTLSESMAPELLVELVNECLTPLTEIVFEEDGTLDKYMGDALMAFWAAPTEQPDHALRACRAVWRMGMAMEAVRARWKDRAKVDFGVGVCSGPMVVGNMGSALRFDYTVIGDRVNLASRIEGLNKPFGTRMLIAESTWTQVKGQMAARRLGAVKAKGKSEAVGIYELLAPEAPSPELSKRISGFESALQSFVQGRFDEAERAFRALDQAFPGDGPVRHYLERIAELRRNPPGEGWDGTFVASSK